MDYLDTLRLVVLNPEKFLKELEKEESVRPSIVFFILTAFFNAICLTIIYAVFIIAMYRASSYGTFSWSFLAPNILTVIFLLIFSLVGWFIYASMVHFFAFLFNKNIKFSKTVQIIAYGSAGYFLFSIIPVFGFLSIFYTVYIVALGVAKFHKIEMPKAIAAAILPIIILIVLILLFIFFIIYSFTTSFH